MNPPILQDVRPARPQAPAAAPARAPTRALPAIALPAPHARPRRKHRPKDRARCCYIMLTFSHPPTTSSMFTVAAPSHHAWYIFLHGAPPAAAAPSPAGRAGPGERAATAQMYHRAGRGRRGTAAPGPRGAPSSRAGRRARRVWATRARVEPISTAAQRRRWSQRSSNVGVGVPGSRPQGWASYGVSHMHGAARTHNVITGRVGAGLRAAGRTMWGKSPGYRGPSSPTPSVLWEAAVRGSRAATLVATLSRDSFGRVDSFGQAVLNARGRRRNR